VLQQLLERGVAALVDVHLDPVEDGLEVLARNRERPHDLGEVDGDRPGRVALVRPGQLGPPLREHPSLLPGARLSLVYGVVDGPAEGVESVDGLTLPARETEERVVEVGPAPAGQGGGALRGVHVQASTRRSEPAAEVPIIHGAPELPDAGGRSWRD